MVECISNNCLGSSARLFAKYWKHYSSYVKLEVCKWDVIAENEVGLCRKLCTAQALLRHCSCLGKRTLIRSMRPGLGCSPSFHHALCWPWELHGNECLISASLVALELVPPTLPGLCACSLGARAGAGGGRQKYCQEGGFWFGYWDRKKLCFSQITPWWCGLTFISFRHYTGHGSPKRTSFHFRFTHMTRI